MENPKQKLESLEQGPFKNIKFAKARGSLQKLVDVKIISSTEPSKF